MSVYNNLGKSPSKGYFKPYNQGGDDFIDCNGSFSEEDGSVDDPPWQEKVGERGELFYLEAKDPVEYVHAPSVQRHPYNGSVVHATQLTNHRRHGSSSVDSTETPTSKKIKKKMKKLITSSSSKKRGSKLTGSQLSKHNLNSAGHGVTFNDVPTGVLKEAVIFVDPFKHNYGRRATQAENLFGIIPGHFGSPSLGSDGLSKDRRIMVQGLVPNAEAMNAGVKIGEWLMCVNDLEVNYDNIDSILSGITGPRYIKLTLQKIAIQTSPKQVLVKKKHVVNEKLVKVVSGERLCLPKVSIDHLPHSLMYLHLDCASETMKEKDDVLYQYPEQDSKIVKIRGLFIMLTQMLLDVTNNTAKNTTLSVDGKLVHTAYYKENREVLVFCLPAEKVSLCHLNRLQDDVVRLLKLLFGSLHSAFSNSKNQSQLDHFFSLVFHKVLLGKQLFENGHKRTEELDSFYPLLPGVRSLTLPEETKVTINNCLSELEAADFADMSEDYYDLRRQFTIMGSCLFYKGYLVANHLHREDLVDTYLYLYHYCVLALCDEEQLGQVVLWREVFPTRRCHKQVDPVVPGYSEPEARWFLMVVGMKNLLLGVFLEAGGCASWADGNPGPDAFYVDQAKASLMQLESLDVINQCESRLQSASVPSLACIDWMLPSTGKSQKALKDSLDHSGKSQPSPRTVALKKSTTKEPESILKKTSQDDRYKGRGAMYDMDSDLESHSTNSEGSATIFNRLFSSRASEDSIETSSSSSGLFKSSKRRRNLMYAYDMTGLKKNLDAENSGSFVKITSGHSNTLFQYVSLDWVDGVFICPCQQELADVKGVLHREVLHNFQQSCVAIRTVLQQSRKKQEWIRDGSLGKFGPCDSLGVVREHGVLFECQSPNSIDSKKPAHTATYWVVGRMIDAPYPKEFYVCFLDTAQQNCVEMAFKLGFGSNLM